MPRMRALRDLQYDYKNVPNGAEFDAGEQEALTLRTIGYAADVTVENKENTDEPYDSGVVPLTMYEVADAAADDDVPVKRKPGRPKGSKNAYERRDMRAKE